MKSKVIKTNYTWEIPNFAYRVAEGWTSIEGPVICTVELLLMCRSCTWYRTATDIYEFQQFQNATNIRPTIMYLGVYRVAQEK